MPFSGLGVVHWLVVWYVLPWQHHNIGLPSPLSSSSSSFFISAAYWLRAQLPRTVGCSCLETTLHLWAHEGNKSMNDCTQLAALLLLLVLHKYSTLSCDWYSLLPSLPFPPLPSLPPFPSLFSYPSLPPLPPPPPPSLTDWWYWWTAISVLAFQWPTICHQPPQR